MFVRMNENAVLSRSCAAVHARAVMAGIPVPSPPDISSTFMFVESEIRHIEDFFTVYVWVEA